MILPALKLDLPDYTDGSASHLVQAKNVYPASIGYKPFKGLSAATGAMPAAWVGGGAFEYNGTKVMLGATAAGLYSHSGGVWTSEYVVATTQPWFFLPFGDLAIGFNGGAPVKYTISTGAAAALGGSPPSASFGAVVADFVMTAGDASAAQTVSWCAINDAEGWTFGTDEADQQEIPDGGPITGIAGGEQGIVFQREQYSIFNYVGVPFVFTRRTIPGIGALTHGGIAQWGGHTFFLSAMGFYLLINGELVPIGQDAVDRAFLDGYTLSDIENYLRCVIDKDRKVTMWIMPDKIWTCYWGSGFNAVKWSTTEISGVVGAAQAVTASATLEEIAVIYPSIEDVTPVLDDAYWRGGTPLLLLFKTDKIGYTFSSGSNLEATWKLCKLEPVKGRTTHIHNSRPDTDAVSGITVTIDTSFRQGDAATSVNSADLRASGDVPIRATGQYLQPQVKIAAGTDWTYLSALDLEGTPGGRL